MKKGLFLIAMLCVWTYAAFAADTIKIGLLAPITGSYASEGQGMKQVLELMTADVNAKGGIRAKGSRWLPKTTGAIRARRLWRRTSLFRRAWLP